MLLLFLKGKKLHAKEAAGHPPYRHDIDDDSARFIRNRKPQDQQHVSANKHVAFYLASSDGEIAGGSVAFGVACKGDRELDVQPFLS